MYSVNKYHGVLPGLCSLRDELNSDDHSNAPYLVAVWDELVHAHQPVAVRRTCNGQKIDVVAENGTRWIRVNTIKNTRLTMEMNSDDDDDDESPELDNSVLRMGMALLAAAKANPVMTTTIVPSVTIRLTRLDPLTDDARITQTIQRLRDMGIDVRLGERTHHSAPPETPPSPRPLRPTADVNLDLSALIALVSDISHAPLPPSEQAAHARFVPPQSSKRERTRALAQIDDNQHRLKHTEEEDMSGPHSRALTAQTIQEMHRGILDEIHDRTTLSPDSNVRFWTTREARQRCLQIVAKIGGDRERQRADALLGSTRCRSNHTNDIAQGGTPTQVEAYWQHSRYPVGFLPLLVPVCVYPPSLPAPEHPNQARRTIFGDALVWTCTRILRSDERTPGNEDNNEGNDDGDVPPPARTSIPKLTVHTVSSMLAGASRGHTTLTTNRSSVRAVLRAMHAGNTYPSPYAYQDEHEDSMQRVAALWALDPRSLAEGMRSN